MFIAGTQFQTNPAGRLSLDLVEWFRLNLPDNKAVPRPMPWDATFAQAALVR